MPTAFRLLTDRPGAASVAGAAAGEGGSGIAAEPGFQAVGKM